jgi:hypothetical protein
MCDAAIDDHLWMASVDPFFYEYCLVVSVFLWIFSYQINCLFPALPNEEGIGISRFTLVERGTDTSPHGPTLPVMDKLKTAGWLPRGE